ncbi:MAG: histidine phosphatase family protein, partial [Dehalococcoidia bacterium]
DVPLSDLGREQVREIAAALADTCAAAVYSSDLLRALDTARPIADRLRLPLVEEPALRERDFGVLQGRLYADVLDELRTAWSDPDSRPHGAESWRDVYARVARFLDRLRAAPPGCELILVTHGGTLNVAAACLAGTRVEDMQWQQIDNCAVITLPLPLD